MEDGRCRMTSFSDENIRFFESLPLPLALYQKIDGKIACILVSDGLCGMMKTERGQLIDILNNRLFERVHPDDVGRITRIVSEFSQYLCGYDVIYRSKYDPDGDYHYVHSTAKIFNAPDGRPTALFAYSDVSESESQSRMLIESYKMFQNDHFYSDPVTGLPNMNFLIEFKDDIYNKALDSNKTPALFYFDVNGLRFYNSQYGVAKGDDLMRLITDILKSEFPGAFIGRGVDDHFIMITNFTDDDHFTLKLNSVNEKIKAGAIGNTPGIRTGICLLDSGIKLPDALDYAKHALKKIGSDINCTHLFYTQELDDKYWEQRYILESFDTALKEGWIKVYYQAIIRLKTGKAAAMEALARWVDPLRGTIMPAVFIPVLEKYHQLYKLDLYMVEQICREIPLREKVGLPIIPVSVNFSAQDFDHADIVGSLNEIFVRYPVGKRNIIIEITEQDIAKATDVFKQQLRDLRSSGFMVWIDDFGSGYSSLNIFSQYKVDLTKFDIDFLRNLDENEGANRHIMKAMVEVTKKLGIRSLAEGVESEEQMEFLKSIGCDFAQGYYYFRPESLGSIAFKIQNGSQILPCETPEEYSQIRKEYEETYRKIIEF